MLLPIERFSDCRTRELRERRSPIVWLSKWLPRIFATPCRLDGAEWRSIALLVDGILRTAPEVALIVPISEIHPFDLVKDFTLIRSTTVAGYKHHTLLTADDAKRFRIGDMVEEADGSTADAANPWCSTALRLSVWWTSSQPARQRGHVRSVLLCLEHSFVHFMHHK